MHDRHWLEGGGSNAGVAIRAQAGDDEVRAEPLVDRHGRLVSTDLEERLTVLYDVGDALGLKPDQVLGGADDPQVEPWTASLVERPAWTSESRVLVARVDLVHGSAGVVELGEARAERDLTLQCDAALGHPEGVVRVVDPVLVLDVEVGEIVLTPFGGGQGKLEVLLAHHCELLRQLILARCDQAAVELEVLAIDDRAVAWDRTEHWRRRRNRRGRRDSRRDRRHLSRSGRGCRNHCRLSD